MQLPNGRFIGRDLADENKTWRKMVVLGQLRPQLKCLVCDDVEEREEIADTHAEDD